MIAFIEYQSEDGMRSATVTRLNERRWLVLRLWAAKSSGRQMAIGPIEFRTLTGAQSNARVWCQHKADKRR